MRGVADILLLILAVVVASDAVHPWLNLPQLPSRLALSFCVIYLMGGQILFVLRKILLLSVETVSVRNASPTAIYMAFFDSRFRRLSDVAYMGPGTQRNLRLPRVDSLRHEQIVCWSEQLAALERPEKGLCQWRTLGWGSPGSNRSFVLTTTPLQRHGSQVVLQTPAEMALDARIQSFISSHVSATKLADLSSASAPVDMMSEPVRVEHLGWGEICQAERQWLEKRRAHTRRALASLVPGCQGDCTIALFSSGGGMRATIAFLGALYGLEKVNLLPAITFMAGVSGSAWGVALAAYQFEQSAREGSSVKETMERMRMAVRDAVAKPPLPPLAEAAKIVLQKAAETIRNRSTLSLVSSFGALLKAALPVGSRLSDQQEFVAGGEAPLPMYAVGFLDEVHDVVSTAELTPLSVRFHNDVITPRAFGSRFDRDETVTFAPELGMDDLMGVFGSAFCTTVEKVVENAFWVGSEGANALQQYFKEGSTDKVRDSIRQKLETYGAAYRDLWLSIPAVHPLHVPNISFDSGGEQYIPSNVPVFDAGIHVNLPWSFAQRSQRGIDIIIALDHADDIKGKSGFLTLQGINRMRAEEIASKGSTRLPEASLVGMDKKRVYVFGDASRGEIVVIYIPLKSPTEDQFDPIAEMGLGGFCNTLNFRYSNEEFDKLFDLSAFNMRYHRETILKTISSVMSKTAIK